MNKDDLKKMTGELIASVSEAIVIGTTEKVLKKYLADSLVKTLLDDIRNELKKRDTQGGQTT